MSEFRSIRASFLEYITGAAPHTDHPARHWDRTCPACNSPQSSTQSAGAEPFDACALLEKWTGDGHLQTFEDRERFRMEAHRPPHEANCVARPISEWADDDGDVLLWRFPINEPPRVGSPLDAWWWPDYYTHWTPLPKAPSQYVPQPLQQEKA